MGVFSPPRYRGFTLFELLIVLVILSFTLALAVPRIGASLSASDLQSSARQVLSSMRLARSQAIQRQQPVDFFVDVKQRYYKTGSTGESRRLPQHANITLYTARSQLQDDGSGYIRFFPDGSASGGRITLSSDQDSHLIDVNWLTGGVTVAQAAVSSR